MSDLRSQPSAAPGSSPIELRPSATGARSVAAAPGRVVLRADAFVALLTPETAAALTGVEPHAAALHDACGTGAVDAEAAGAPPVGADGRPSRGKCDTLHVAPGERRDAPFTCTTPGSSVLPCHILPLPGLEDGDADQLVARRGHC